MAIIKEINANNHLPKGKDKFPVYSKQFNELARQVNNIDEKVILLSEIKYINPEFTDTAAVSFSRTISAIKPAGYKAVELVIEVVEQFSIDSTVVAPKIVGYFPNTSGFVRDSSSVPYIKGLYQSIDLISGPFSNDLKISGPAEYEQINRRCIVPITTTSDMNVDFAYSTSNINSYTWTSGHIKVYLIAKKFSL